MRRTDIRNLILAGVAAIFAPCSAYAAVENADSQFNALDHVLQKPAPARLFENKRFADHSFISIEGGTTFARSSRGVAPLWHSTEDPGYRLGLTFGDWVTPVHGWRVSLNAGRHHDTNQYNAYFGGVSADYMLNFTQLLKGNDPSAVFELIGTAGAEYQRLYSHVGWGNLGGLRVGLQARFNVSPSTFLYLEPRFGVYTDGLDGARSWQRYDWEASIMMGLGYRVIWGPKRYRGKYKFEQNSAADNFFYGIQGGVTATSHHDLFHNLNDRIGVQGSLFAGKWFSASSGLRLTATLGTAGKADHDLTRKFIAAELDYMLNLNSAFNGYRPFSRFESNIAIGPAMIYTNGSKHKFFPALGAGWQLMYNTEMGLGIFLEPHLWITGSRFLFREDSKYSPFDVVTSLNLGIQYRIDGYNRRRKGYDKSNDYRDFLASNRCFMSVAAGAFSHSKKFARTVAFYGGVGRWFTPYSAWRLGFDYEFFNRPEKYMSLSLDADYMLSLSTLTAGVNPDRVFDLSFVAGGQLGISHYKQGNHVLAGIKGALNGRFNISRSLDLFLEPAVIAQHMPGYDGRTFKPQFRFMAGITYKLGAAAQKGDHSAGDKATFVSLAGGPSLFSETILSRKLRRVGGGLQVAVGRWLSDNSGLQLGYDYDCVVLPKAKDVNLSTLHLDYMLNLSQLFEPKPDRVFSITPRIGAGVAWSSSKGSGTGFSLLGGVKFGWRLPSDITLFTEPSMTLWQVKMCRYRGNSHNYVGVGRLNVGVTYNF